MVLGALAAISVLAQGAQGIPVSVEHSGADDTGNRFVFELKEDIRRSGLLRLSDDTPNPIGYRLHVTTVGADAPLDGITVYSVILTFAWKDGQYATDEYYTAWTGYCGSNVAASCAQNVFEAIGHTIEANRDALAEILKDFPQKPKPGV